MIPKNQLLPEVSLNHLPSVLEWKMQGKNIFNKARGNRFFCAFDDDRPIGFLYLVQTVKIRWKSR